jgi:hypothetical protein
MRNSAQEILSILDDCCDAFTFPMLDNGYVYLAATCLSAFRSQDDWALTIEVFGFSPRAECPDIHIYTFASKLQNRKRPEDYVSREAYERYLANNPYDESRFVYPIADENWLDEEFVAEGAAEIMLRGSPFPVPRRKDYRPHGIELANERRIQVFELCRYLADVRRAEVLATADELRGNLAPNMKSILQLDEWHHPDVADDSCRPSGSETFQQIAEVLVKGDASAYSPTSLPNTHWRHWPTGGTL